MRAETAASRWVETYKALISWYINVRGAHPQERGCRIFGACVCASFAGPVERQACGGEAYGAR